MSFFRLILYWFARLPFVWAVLSGFAVSWLMGSIEWYLRVPVIGLVSLVVLGLAYIARAMLIAQIRDEASPLQPADGAASAAPSESTPAQKRRVRRRR